MLPIESSQFRQLFQMVRVGGTTVLWVNWANHWVYRKPRTWCLFSYATAAVLFALSFQPCALEAEPQLKDRVGDVYELRLERMYKRSGDESSGASGSSRTGLMLVERVVDVKSNGVELEFDLPANTSADSRAREWHFPVRVFKSWAGPLELQNVAELELRLQSWLERAKLDRVSCGKWFFTWTTQQINCDPYSVIQNLEPFDLRQYHLRDGALHQELGAREPSPLSLQKATPTGMFFGLEAEINPDFVRRRRAKRDVVVAEIMGQGPLAFSVALQARSSERISGTIMTSLETDSLGRVIQRMRITKIEIVGEGGLWSNEEIFDKVERRFITGP